MSVAPADPGPFGIDTDEYSDREREMFVLGVEFEKVSRSIRQVGSGVGSCSVIASISRMIHVENCPRLVRVAVAAGLDVETEWAKDGWCRFRAKEG